MSIIEKALNNPDKNEAIIAIDEYLSSRFFDKPLSMSDQEKDVVYIENLEREINNGGFNQFFWNSSGDYVKETVIALEKIGASKPTDILKKAITVFPNSEVPTERETRQDMIDEIEDDAEELWDELDNMFYKYEDDIAGLIFKYIKNNRDKFK